MKDRLHNLFDLAKPLVAEVVTDARDTAGWVIDRGKAVIDKAADISPIVIVRKPTITTTADLQWTVPAVTPPPEGEYVWKPNITTSVGGTTT